MRELFHLRKILFGLAFVISIALFICYDTSRFAWTSLQSLQSKFVDHESTCTIKWADPRIITSEYETTQKPSLPAADHRGRLPRPVPVKPIYPNPVIKLRSDYFVLATLQNGPNNQLVGFREAIFLAIKLNRTIVLPHFIKHHTDERSLPLVSPVHRLQVSDLCTFVSCITLEQFRRACGYVLHSILNTRALPDIYFSKVAESLGMKLDKPKLPRIPDDALKGGTARHYKGSDIPALFTTKARCVIFPKPLSNLHTASTNKDREEFARKKNFVKSLKDMKSVSEYHLAKTISYHTRSPKYITDLAGKFAVHSMNSQPYISVHWRYQPDEFMLRCRNNPSANPVKSKICENAMDITPLDIAVAIEKKIASIGNPNMKYIYFATPSSEHKILSEVATYLHNTHGYLTYSFLDLEKFLTTKFAPCHQLKDHFNDILSTTEMEMCALSNVFLGSMRSSWSDVVHVARLTSTSIDNTKDGDIFTLSLDVLNQRKGDPT